MTLATTMTAAHLGLIYLLVPLANGVMVGTLAGEMFTRWKHNDEVGTQYLPRSTSWRYLRPILASQPLPKYLRSSVVSNVLLCIGAVVLIANAPGTWPFAGQFNWDFHTWFTALAMAFLPVAVPLSLRRLRRDMLTHARWLEINMEENEIDRLLSEESAQVLERKTVAAVEQAMKPRRL